ncbi:MAG: RDD family protein [bacterium]|nr:RDD family protein [bacterium]
MAFEPGALPGLTGFEDHPAEPRGASFGARAVAAVIDFVILQMASAIVNSMFLGLLLNNLNATTILAATMGPLLVGGVFALLYSVWLESSSWQATPGKRIMGLKVVDLHGQRIGFGAASWRNLAKGLSMLTFGVGYLMPLWSSRRQALHDKVTGCLVIRSA